MTMTDEEAANVKYLEALEVAKAEIDAITPQYNHLSRRMRYLRGLCTNIAELTGAEVDDEYTHRRPVSEAHDAMLSGKPPLPQQVCYACTGAAPPPSFTRTPLSFCPQCRHTWRLQNNKMEKGNKR